VVLGTPGPADTGDAETKGAPPAPEPPQVRGLGVTSRCRLDVQRKRTSQPAASTQNGRQPQAALARDTHHLQPARRQQASSTDLRSRDRSGAPVTWPTSLQTRGCRRHLGSVLTLVDRVCRRCRVQTARGRHSFVSNRVGRDGVAEAPFPRGRSYDRIRFASGSRSYGHHCTGTATDPSPFWVSWPLAKRQPACS
jgi:hypothetical protein